MKVKSGLQLLYKKKKVFTKLLNHACSGDTWFYFKARGIFGEIQTVRNKSKIQSFGAAGGELPE